MKVLFDRIRQTWNLMVKLERLNREKGLLDENSGESACTVFTPLKTVLRIKA